MIVLTTERLTLRWFTIDDAPFILTLMNDPDWLRFIGNKGVKNLADAVNYIRSKPIAMYEGAGFGLYLVLRRSDQIPLGMCGLIKRDGLDDVDIGFAFLPAFTGMGYAIEAARATMDLGRSQFGLTRIVGITSQDNVRSIKLLEKIGLQYERDVQLPMSEEVLKLFGWRGREMQR